MTITLALLLVPMAWSGSKFKVIHQFGSGTDGTFPHGPPVLDKQGNLYGITSGGGTYGYGTVFELSALAKGGLRETILYSFSNQGDRGDPVGNLVQDNHLNLFGTLNGEGPGQGAIFELQPSSANSDLSLLYDQNFSPGLVLDTAGDLFGFIGAGDYGSGAIGELSPGTTGWSYTQLYSFCTPTSCPDGDGPLAPPSWDSKGNLYGTTYFGGYGPPKCPGLVGCGVAFELSHNSDGTWTYHVMHRFAATPTDGQYPYGPLTLDGKGVAYGTTAEGGPGCVGPPGCGTVFTLTPLRSAASFWTETIIYDFSSSPICSLGCGPGGNLVFDRAGNIYGIAGGGDLSCPLTCGVVFRLSPQPNGQWAYSVIHFFHGADGSAPFGLTIDSRGDLFGTTQTGGAYNGGVVYVITP